MLNIWTVKSGYNFGIVNERTTLNLSLPITYNNNFDDSVNLDFTVISGSLPPGLKIRDDKIIGTPFEVPRDTEYRFVIRASYNGEISDRTFLMTISGSDTPEWRTASGSLPIGVNDGQEETLDYPFLNGCHYMYQNLCIYTRRQDPFGNFGLQYNLSFPIDKNGYIIQTNFNTKKADDVC